MYKPSNTKIEDRAIGALSNIITKKMKKICDISTDAC